MFAGPMSPGAPLIVTSCGTNISANVNCITISLWLYDFLKVVPDLQLDPRGPLLGPPKVDTWNPSLTLPRFATQGSLRK